MQKYFYTLLTLLLFTTSSFTQTPPNTREVWLAYMDKVARPVMENLAKDMLKENMPITLSKKIDNPTQRTKVAYLEAYARTLCGIAPWLNSESGSDKELKLRKQYRAWALKGLTNAVDSTKRDFMVWKGGQPLVDDSFFALALVRCPWLWNNMEEKQREDVVSALKLSRATIPVYSNWILFSGMIEAFFCKYQLPYDALRLEYGLREFYENWYVGDGMYSDGAHFALDYYNSYVIQPYMANILDITAANDKRFGWAIAKTAKINARYAEIQERSINTDGTFPIYGRSITYRGAAFHHLADMALRHKLPASMNPAQVRCGLTEVIKRTLEAPANFTKDGWLNIGLCGNQPDIADFYINTGSLYLCSTIFLPLGLPTDDPFWAAPDAPWTAKKAWSGMDITADHSMNE